MTCHANYYDLQSSEAYSVILSAEPDGLRIQGDKASDNINMLWQMSGVHVSERLGSAPRTLRHSNKGFCEVADLNSLDTLLNDLNHTLNLLELVQHSTPAMLLSVAIFIMILGVSYLIGLPLASKVIAMQLPQTTLKMLDNTTLESLETYKFLTPSKLTPQRQQALTAEFAKLVENSEKSGLNAVELSHPDHYQLIYRASEPLGANAFALPSGTIVMLDDLVTLSSNDNELMGVLAHELGHVQRRHAARMVLQTSIVGLAAAWWLGDVSTLLAAAPAAILGAKYSRDMEREADSYGVALMQKNGLSSCYLASMLGKLEENFKQKQASTANKMNKKQIDKTKVSNHSENKILSQIGNYLSSHPATPERMKSLCPAQ
ncbi:MAG: M48 family metallopeptidase [Methylophilaceae bacterium]|nr:M48 family metallopeptidase [Methylophilaceae bacterium]